MRAMADTNPNNSTSDIARRRKVWRWRPWVQTAFLTVWLAPLSRWLHRVPGCAFHCYACPLSSFACPVGIVAGFSSLHLFPLLAVGVVLLAAVLVGSLLCGWACPFGFIQDLLAKVPLRKFTLPRWLGVGRYVVLAGSVLLVPFVWGESHPLAICRICPAGALEAGVPRMILSAVSDQPQVVLSTVKWFILAAFLLAAVITFRPWCRVFCPLGGFLSLLNRVSLFRLRFRAEACRACPTCRSVCPVDVTGPAHVNSSRCIRCLKCTTCGAIDAVLATPPSAAGATSPK
jgi:ferredoxin-type protein NapH